MVRKSLLAITVFCGLLSFSHVDAGFQQGGKPATNASKSRQAFVGRVVQGSLGVGEGLLAFPLNAHCDVDCGGGNRCGDGKNCCYARDNVFDGCCPSTLPHSCKSSSRCYEKLADAEAACGSDPVYVCGR
jgi:hypothetical protein